MYREPVTLKPLEKKAEGYFCATSGRLYPLVKGIPRFCAAENYAENFGDQWNAFSKTQHDSERETEVTAHRLWSGTEWNPPDLAGKRILELGCGAGRFTGCFLEAGAEVWSVDLSSAVEACYSNHGSNSRLHVCQASLFELPFCTGEFDFVFMYGVMQHTPDPDEALNLAVRMAAPGGSVAVDVYHKKLRYGRFSSKYRWRWLSTRLPPRMLRRFVEWYIPRWLPVDNWLTDHSPRMAAWLATVVPCWNYRNILPLTQKELVEWAILDTYDALGARYDRPYTRLQFVKSLSRIADIEFTVKRGGNGLEASICKLPLSR